MRTARRWAIAAFPTLFLRLARTDSAELGLAGEELAARALKRAGWKLLARRLVTPHGEVDVVASGGGLLVCVEVKTGRLPDLPRPRGEQFEVAAGAGIPAAHLRWRPGLRLDRERLERQRRAGRWLARRLGGDARGPAKLVGGRVDLIEILVPARAGRPVLVHHADLRRPPWPVQAPPG